MSSSRNGLSEGAERPVVTGPVPTGHELDVERDSDVPISTQIFWQLAYQIESGRLLPGARLPPVRELGAALRVNPNTIRAVYRRLADAGYVISRHGAGTRVVDRPPVAPRLGGPGRDRGRDAAPGRPAGLHRRRGGGRPPSPPPPSASVPGRTSGSCSPSAPPPTPATTPSASPRRSPARSRSRARPARRAARAARPLPLRPGRHDHVPRRRGAGLRRRARPGGRDARRARLHVARPRDRRPAGGLQGRASSAARSAASRTSPRCWRSPAPRGVEIISAVAAHRGGARARRPDGRPHPAVARGARRWGSSPVHAARSGSASGPTSSTRPRLELLRRAIEQVAEHRADAEADEARPGRASDAPDDRGRVTAAPDGATLVACEPCPSRAPHAALPARRRHRGRAARRIGTRGRTLARREPAGGPPGRRPR